MVLENRSVRRQVKANKEDVRELQSIVNAPFRRLSKDSPRGVGGEGVGGTSKAFAKVAAGAGATLVCFLDTDATGDEITVNFSISRGTALNAALPRLQDGDLIFVQNFSTDDWWCVQTFHGSEDCVCNSE